MNRHFLWLLSIYKVCQRTRRSKRYQRFHIFKKLTIHLYSRLYVLKCDFLLVYVTMYYSKPPQMKYSFYRNLVTKFCEVTNCLSFMLGLLMIVESHGILTSRSWIQYLIQQSSIFQRLSGRRTLENDSYSHSQSVTVSDEKSSSQTFLFKNRWIFNFEKKKEISLDTRS